MTTSVQWPPETGRTATNGLAGPCPECMASFAPAHPMQLFCSPTHRDAWNNRYSVRGRVLTPLAIVARLTRDGTRGDRATGKRAATDQANLIQRWRDEDLAANRMPWPEYLRRRYAIGYDPL